MRIIMFLAISILMAPSLSTASAATADFPPVAVAQLSQFQVGDSWSWTYSSRDTQTGAWTPYLVETYVLTGRAGEKLTFEMQSSSLPARPSPAHHKFIVNFADCERAAEGGPADWTIAFYSRSLGPGWTRVSQHFENFAFTEKFNCVRPSPSASVDSATFMWRGIETKVFSVTQPSDSGASFYFLDLPGLSGVAAQKFFTPNGQYKFVINGAKNSRARSLPDSGGAGSR